MKKKNTSGEKRRSKPNNQNFGIQIASAFLRNAPLLAAGIVLLIFSAFLGKTILYIGISLCIAYLGSCGFQIIFESSTRGSKFAEEASDGDKKKDGSNNKKAD